MKPFPSVQAFHAGIIDYAGLFPPALLPLQEAFPNYTRYRSGPDAWMLARFICPVGRLKNLPAFAPRRQAAPPLLFSVLATGGADGPAFLQALRQDRQAVDAFERTHPGQVRADQMEVRLPGTLQAASAEAWAAFLEAVAATASAARLFFEVPLGDEVRERLPPVLAALSSANGQGNRFGLKIRCGGVEASAFPTTGDVAFTLTACRDAGVPFKATAGLHHPVRRYDEAIQTKMHGFFNVFGAAVLAKVHGLDEAAVHTIIADEDAAHFRFTAEAFHWRGLSAGEAAIRQARTRSALSFGSCSFDEPREDLQALGLL